MKKLFVAMLSTVAIALIVNGHATAEDRCTCEDWDRDGKVLKGNVGRYDDCMRFAEKMTQCRD